MSVGIRESQLTPYFEKLSAQFDRVNVSVGCINSPGNITVSGDANQIDALELLLREEQVFARKLRVGVAYHSPAMQRIAAEYSTLIENLEQGWSGRATQQQPRMVSTVTGSEVLETRLREPSYWVSNLTSPVRFSEAMARACGGNREKTAKNLDGSHGHTIDIHDIIEIGPHSALQGPIRDILKPLHRAGEISYQAALIRNNDSASSLLGAIGRLYCSGHLVDIDKVNRLKVKGTDALPILVDLPEYPFNHSKSYWTESRLSKALRFRNAPRLDLLGIPDVDWNPQVAKWRHTIRVSDLPWVEDHKVPDNDPLTPFRC